MSFTDEQLTAAATWWADRLHGRNPKLSTEPDDVTNIKERARKDVAGLSEQFSLKVDADRVITDEQYQTFIKALVLHLKSDIQNPQKTFEGMAFIPVETDYMPISASLKLACQLAGITGSLNLPSKTLMYIYEDGTILAPEKRIGLLSSVAYEGQPDVAYANLYTSEECEKIDLSDCTYYINENHYKSYELTAGQEYTSVTFGLNRQPEYKTRIAAEGEVLVIAKSSTRDFESVTREQAFNPQANSNILWAQAWKQEEVADGSAGRWGDRVERLGKDGAFRVLSQPFRLKALTAPFATGTGEEYQVLVPGDVLRVTVQKYEDREFINIQPVRKALRDQQNWVRSTSDGKPLAAVKPVKPAKGKTVTP